MILLVCPARGGQSEPQGGLGCTHATAPRLESPTDADSTSLRQNDTLQWFDDLVLQQVVPRRTLDAISRCDRHKLACLLNVVQPELGIPPNFLSNKHKRKKRENQSSNRAPGGAVNGRTIFCGSVTSCPVRRAAAASIAGLIQLTFQSRRGSIESKLACGESNQRDDVQGIVSRVDHLVGPIDGTAQWG